MSVIRCFSCSLLSPLFGILSRDLIVKETAATSRKANQSAA